jgi:hypothetical protein
MARALFATALAQALVAAIDGPKGRVAQRRRKIVKFRPNPELQTDA